MLAAACRRPCRAREIAWRKSLQTGRVEHLCWRGLRARAMENVWHEDMGLAPRRALRARRCGAQPPPGFEHFTTATASTRRRCPPTRQHTWRPRSVGKPAGFATSRRVASTRASSTIDGHGPRLRSEHCAARYWTRAGEHVDGVRNALVVLTNRTRSPSLRGLPSSSRGAPVLKYFWCTHGASRACGAFSYNWYEPTAAIQSPDFKAELAAMGEGV